jgi:hypothetical protein
MERIWQIIKGGTAIARQTVKAWLLNDTHNSDDIKGRRREKTPDPAAWWVVVTVH